MQPLCLAKAVRARVLVECDRPRLDAHANELSSVLRVVNEANDQSNHPQGLIVCNRTDPKRNLSLSYVFSDCHDRMSVVDTH